MSLTPKSKIEKSYEWHEPLGSGVSGSVYRVTQKTDPSISYAAKIFHNSSSSFLHAGIEKENLRRVEKAPHVLRFHELNLFHGHLTLVTNFVSGTTLLHHLKKKPSMDLIHQTIQILEFLVHIHSMGYAYFDLKPENVLFNEKDKTITVIDLGSMYLTTRLLGGLVGTNFYRSLSIWLNGPYDTSTDMWAFGCLLFELFTQGPLFAIQGEDSDQSTANKYVNMIVAQCGMPPACFLERHHNTALFFNKGSKGYTLKNPIALNIMPWKSSMRSWQSISTTDEIERLIDLIDKCLHYEKPLTAQEALNHPFFRRTTTHFSIVLSESTLRRYTLCINSEIDPHPTLMRLHLSEMHKLDCLHVKTELKRRYIVCLIDAQKKEVIEGQCSIYIKNHDQLIISKNPFGHWIFRKEPLKGASPKPHLDTTPSIEESKKSTSA